MNGEHNEHSARKTKTKNEESHSQNSYAEAEVRMAPPIDRLLESPKTVAGAWPTMAKQRVSSTARIGMFGGSSWFWKTGESRWPDATVDKQAVRSCSTMAKK
jgi:hypothetical protein